MLRHLAVLAALISFLPPASASPERVLDGRVYRVHEDGRLERSGADGTFTVDPRVVTVKFRQGVSADDQATVIAELGAVELRRARTGFVDLEIAEGGNVLDAIQALRARKEIAVAEPNTIGEYLFVPDDTLYGNQWHLPQVMAEEAWDIEPGAPVAIVAVLDSGTEFDHDDLGPGSDGYRNVWLNEGEDAWSDPENPATGNGIDDDGNGFIDDWQGWNFGDGDNDPSGSFFHGTAVAGAVAAKTDNALGVAGIAGGDTGPGTRVLIAGVGNNAPNGSVLDDAILYAAEMGAQVVQMSLTVGQSSAIDAALAMAYDTFGVISLCASGNGGGGSVGYPSSNPDVMAVGSTNMSDLKSGFSQFGPNLEIAAPGESIWMTDLNDGYGPSSGTSFAAPLASGIVALMLAVDPSLSNDELRQILHDTADKVGPYDYNWDPSNPGHSQELGYGRVNAQAAVEAATLGDLFVDGFESGDTSAWSQTVD